MAAHQLGSLSTALTPPFFLLDSVPKRAQVNSIQVQFESVDSFFELFGEQTNAGVTVPSLVEVTVGLLLVIFL